MGCHAVLQGIFPTQGSNSHLSCRPHWQAHSGTANSRLQSHLCPSPSLRASLLCLGQRRQLLPPGLLQWGRPASFLLLKVISQVPEAKRASGGKVKRWEDFFFKARLTKASDSSETKEETQVFSSTTQAGEMRNILSWELTEAESSESTERNTEGVGVNMCTQGRQREKLKQREMTYFPLPCRSSD